MAKPLYTVGEKLRVTVGPGRTCRGLVLCIGISKQGGDNYDVLLLSINSSKPQKTSTPTGRDATDIQEDATHDSEKELCGLLESDLSHLQPFELDGSIDNDCIPCSDLAVEELSARAEALKDRGNTLFKLGDTDASAEVFERVLRALEPTPIRVGATVLVRRLASTADAPVSYTSGMVSDTNDDGESYDVIYDESDLKNDPKNDPNGTMEDDEENGVEADRVVLMSLSPCISCAARLNLARCWFRAARHADVVEACTMVICLAKLGMADKGRPRDERAKLRSHCVTALRMRGGSHLAQNHVGLARKDARSMARSAGDDGARAQAARFEAEVERKAKALLKANRKLATDVTRWVDASMAKHDGVGASSSLTGDGGEEVSSACSQGRGGGVEETKGWGGGGDSEGGVASWLGSWRR